MEPAPNTLSTYHVFLASPGDLGKERREVRSFFDLWNRAEGVREGVRFEVLDWEYYSSAGVALSSQKLIMKQILERFSESLLLVIGLMGMRFGSPTGESESGTEDELNWALERWREREWPEIKLFFRIQKRVVLDADPEVLSQVAEQLKKVLAFKERCQTGTPQLYYKEFAATGFRDVFELDLRPWLAQYPWRSPRPQKPTLPGPYGPMPAGRPFKEMITDMRMLWVEGGRFQIGQGRYPNAAWVRLSPFWIGEIPVTNRQYGVFLAHSKHREPASWRDPRFSERGQPIVDVSWHDAMAFCQWLSEASGLACTLCTEAQWEYAARGSDGRTYPWGNEEPTEKRACYGLDRNTGCPAPAGIYRRYGRGPFGTLDQTGNVWEWCRDAWREEAYDPWLTTEPLDPFTDVKEECDLEEERILRGASFSDEARLLPVAVRYSRDASYRAIGVGFRVVVNLPGA